MSLLELPYPVCKQVVLSLSDSLADLITLSSLSHDFKSICRHYMSMHFTTFQVRHQGLSTVFPCHQLLLLILKGYVDPLFVQRYQHLPIDAVFRPTPTARPALTHRTKRNVEEYDRLYREAASRILPANILDEACGKFQTGSQDAALAVLLPLFRRLKFLEAPLANGYLCSIVFLGIADKYRDAGITGWQARRHAKAMADQDLVYNGDAVRQRYARPDGEVEHSLPFPELLICKLGDLYTESSNNRFNFVGIPSLHRIIIPFLGGYSHDTWLPDLQCWCPEIHIGRSSASQDMIVRLASELHGPCRIKRWFFVNRGSGWDRVRLTLDDLGAKTIQVWRGRGHGRFRVGYGTALLPWERIADWERLDEEPLSRTVIEGDAWPDPYTTVYFADE